MFKNSLSILALAFVLAGCGANSNDPGAVAREFYIQLGQMNFSGAKELTTEESKQILTVAEGFFNMATEEQKKDMEKQKAEAAANPPQVIDTQINGDSATVTLKIGDETEKVELTKVDGKWKVVFNKAS